jgi:hypothetical protein
MEMTTSTAHGVARRHLRRLPAIASFPGLITVLLAVGQPSRAAETDPCQIGLDRAAYTAAAKRLQEHYSLDRVARDHVEVGVEDLLGLARPLTQRVPIQARAHPDVVFVHPDLSITLGNASQALVLGFALGTPAALPGVDGPEHRLRKGYLPIVESTWKAGQLRLVRTALATLPRDDDVATGTEAQYVVIRVAVTNSGETPTAAALRLVLGLAADSQNVNYAPFAAPISRWQQTALKLKTGGNGLLRDGRALLAYHAGGPTTVTLEESFPGLRGGNQPVELRGALRFDLPLGARETQTVDLVVAGNANLYPPGELKRMAAVRFDRALARTDAYWDRRLAAGMQLVTPEPRVNEIYKHLILSCLANVSKTSGRPWVRPVHATIGPSVWAWEFAHVSVPLASLGYARPMEECLRFFVETQPGIGKYGEDKGPDGEIKSNRGCYHSGNARWMNETGSVLWALAANFRYSRDAERLKANRTSILAAWDWIQRERAATRAVQADGKKVAHYGLLPKGCVHDWGGHRYHYCFTDGYTYRGMAEMAAAFREAGLAEADRLTREAEEYRRCILDVLKRVEYIDPETGLLFVPNTVYFRQGERGGVWVADGPRALFDTGLLGPTDQRWEPMLAMTTRKWGAMAGLLCHFQGALGDEQWKVDADSPYWYVNQTEMAWHRDFLARGEIEKALLVFYANLVYGMSPDCYQTVERVNLAERNYAPFQPNSSGNGRVLAMMRRTVIDEQDGEPGELWLLRGCPRRWFAPGKSILVGNAPTLFGKMSLRTECTAATVTVDVDLPGERPLRRVCLAVRRPGRQKPKSVTVNGKPASFQDEIIALTAPPAHIRVVCAY